MTEESEICKKSHQKNMIIIISNKIIFLIYLLITCAFGGGYQLNTESTPISIKYFRIFDNPWEIFEIIVLFIMVINNILITTLVEKKIVIIKFNKHFLERYDNILYNLSNWPCNIQDCCIFLV
jgi:hypothetical protein